MMPHTNYFEIRADSYFDLGIEQGKLFKAEAHASIAQKKQHTQWRWAIEKSQEYLRFTETAFPHLVEELRGYAQGAEVSFEDLWAGSLEDEIANSDKCTTVISNGGKLIAHNEDWDAGSQDSICILKKSRQNFTVFELFYYNTLGGNSISINSHGFVQTINSLSHTDKQVGIPRNCIARWLSETSDPQDDFRKLINLQRSSGYNHNLVSTHGKVWNIESSATDQTLTEPTTPFFHTNHYLGKLREFENNDNASCTFERYTAAKQHIKNTISVKEAQDLMSDNSAGTKASVFNERTIARMIVDLEKLVAYVWLLREPEKGWVEYDLHTLL